MRFAAVSRYDRATMKKLILAVLAALLPASGRAQIRVITPSVMPLQGPTAPIGTSLGAPSLGAPALAPVLLPAPGVSLETAPLRLVLAGPPGAGKSTQGKRLSAEMGLPHIVASDLLREYAKTDPAVLETMNRGELVNPELIIALVKERLSRKDLQKGFILDGFPRRLAEAEALQKMAPQIAVDAVIFLNVPDAELLRRIAARGRPDDTEAIFKARLATYRSVTMPAIERLAKDVPLLTPDAASSDIDAGYANVRKALDEFISKR